MLFYAVVLAGLLEYVFIDAEKTSYWRWPMSDKFTALLLILTFTGMLLTSLFKHFRSVDFAVLCLILWVFAAVSGFPLGELVPRIDGPTAVFAGTAAQLAVIAYLVYGTRPNVTYLNRIRRAAA